MEDSIELLANEVKAGEIFLLENEYGYRRICRLLSITNESNGRKVVHYSDINSKEYGNIDEIRFNKANVTVLNKEGKFDYERIL